MIKIYDPQIRKGLITLFLLVLLISLEANAQNEVAIGSSTTKSNAILWLNGNGSQGLILPVVTNRTAVSSPDKGMIVYDNSDNKVWYRNDNAWVEVSGGGSTSTNLTLTLSGNQLQLKDGTTTLSTVNIAGGTASNGAFMVWNGTSWQYAILSGDVSGANGALQVNGIKGKTVPALPTTSTTQALVWDGTAWKFQALTAGTDSQTLTYTSPNLSISGGNSVTLPTGTVTSVTGLTPISVATGTSTPVVSIAQANGTTNGFLSSADFTTFSDKVSLGGDLGGTASSPLISKIQGVVVSSTAPTTDQVLQYNGTNWIPATLAASGDITDVVAGTGLTGGGTSGSVTLNLSNSGVVQGIYGSATAIPQLTIDAQGRITSATTFSPTVADGSITGGSAGLGVKIAANTITDANIASLNADKINAGTLPVAQVPNLDASKITTGTFTTTQIPNLDASKISTGAFNTAQIPNLDASKITTGVISTQQGGTGLSFSAGSIGQGQLLIGTGGAFAKANLTSGNGINITNGAGSIAIAVDAGITANKIVQLDNTGKLPAVDGSLLTNLPAGGDITDVTAGTGLSGGGTIGAVTLNLANTAVTSGSYGTATTIPQITIDQQGRITAANDQTIPTATTTTSGLLTSADWNTFNNKISAITPGTGISIAGTTITNTGDTDATNDITNATTAGGDLSGTYPNPTIGASATTGTNVISAVNAASTSINGARVNPTFGAQAITTSGALTAGATTVGTLSAGATTVTGLTIGTSVWPANTNGVLTNIGGILSWGTPFTNPMTTQGDLIAGGASGTATRLASPGSSRAILGYNGTIPTWVSGSPSQLLGTDGAGELTFINQSGFVTSTTTAGGDLSGTYPNPTIGATATTGGNIITALNAASTFIDGARVNTNFGTQALTAGATTVSGLTIGTSAWPANANGVLTNTGGILTWAPAGGAGTVTGVSVVNANGFTGSVANPTTTPAITIGTSLTGVLKGDGATMSVATAGTDYLTPTGSAALLTGFPILNQNTTGSAATITGTITQSQVTNLTTDLASKQPQLSGTGFVKASGTTISYDNSTYLTSFTETDPSVVAINGLVKSNGVTIGAAIAGTDYLAPNGDGSALTNLNAGSITSGTLSIANGGTNANTLPTSGGVSYGTGTAYGFTAAGTNGQLLQSNGAAAPSWISIPAFLSPSLTSGNIFVGSAGNVATPVALSGDATVTNLGALTIADGAISGGTGGKILDLSITDSDISASAAIAGTKVAPAFGAQAISTTSTLTTGTAGQFVVDATGNITTLNNLTTSFPSVQGAVGSVLTNDGAGVLTWASSGWGLTGNNTIASDFIGTINTQDLVFKTNNAENLRITQAGNVGIGTTTPVNKLDIEGGLAVGATYSGTTAAPTDGAIIEGVVGISTNDPTNGNPYSRLVVQGGITIDNGGANAGTYEYGLIFGNGNSGEVVASNRNPGANQFGLDFYTGYANRMAITSAGNVGIGTATPAQLLDIAGAENSGIDLSTTGGAIKLRSSVNSLVAAQFGTVTNHNLNLFTNNTSVMTLTNTGKVGIGTSTPNAPLQFESQAAARKIVLFEQANNDHEFIGFGVGGFGTLNYQLPVNSNDHVFLAATSSSSSNELMRIKGTGNVGIGTPTPTEVLDVAGNLKFSGALMPNNSAGTLGQVLTSAGPGVAPTWATAGSGTGWSLSGNTISSANYIGTINDLALNFKVNSEKAGGIESDVTGNGTVGLGYRALELNTGTDNTALGTRAMIFNTTASNNTAVGRGALIVSSTGFGSNTAIGSQALYQNTTGYRNTALGYLAGSTTTADPVAGVGITTGNNNTFIGSQSGPSGSGTLTNATAVGANAKVTLNNTMVFGNGVVGWGFGVQPGGAAIRVGTNATNGNGATLTLAGAWTVGSDSTKKYNVMPLNYGLAEVMKLKPVNYQWKNTLQKDFGFLAQDVKTVLPEIVYGEEGQMTVSYGQITAVLTKAMQEQQLEIEALKAQLKEKDDKVNTLEGSVSSMKDELENIKRALGIQPTVKMNGKK